MNLYFRMLYNKKFIKIILLYLFLECYNTRNNSSFSYIYYYINILINRSSLLLLLFFLFKENINEMIRVRKKKSFIECQSIDDSLITN